MDEDALSAIAARLTNNGARNLRQTIEMPHGEHPGLLNGGRRLDTGAGKWTTLAERGVLSNLRSLGLIETGMLPWDDRGPEGDAECDVLTLAGREVAAFVAANWDRLRFRDTRAEQDERDRRYRERNRRKPATG